MTHPATKSHATWSASATARNWACPGALTLAARAGAEDRESEAAAWGTACHEVAEKALRSGGVAIEWLDTVIKTDRFEIRVDEEMVDTAQQFVDYVQSGTEDDGMLLIEQHFSLAALNPPFDAGGTCDAILYTPRNKHIEVVDLKGGRGVVVEAKGNPQLRTYALGAMLANPGLTVDKVTVTIVQPRAPHKDGRIRSETFHVADLLEWTIDLLAAMRESDRARRAYEGVPRNFPAAAWEAEFLKAGDHCKFCPAAGFCPALEQRALDAAGVWFDDQDQPRMSNAPDNMAVSELARKLDMFDMISEWMNAVRAYAHAQAELGVEIPGYQLTEKIGNRAWKFDDESIALKLRAEGVEPFTQKIVSPAQAEKLLGAKRKAVVADLVERPQRGTSLVSVAKTSKPAVQSLPSKFFEAT